MPLWGAAWLVSVVCQAVWGLSKLHPQNRAFPPVALSHHYICIAPSGAAAPSAGLPPTNPADEHLPPVPTSCIWSMVPRTRSQWCHWAVAQLCCKAPSPVWPHPWHKPTLASPPIATNQGLFHINQDLFIRVREAGNSTYVFFHCDEVSADLINSLRTKRNLHSYFIDTYCCPFLIRGQVYFARDVPGKFNVLFDERLNTPHGAVSSSCRSVQCL